MTTINLPSGEWLLVKVGPNQRGVVLVASTYYATPFIYLKEAGVIVYLPEGSYQLHGSDPLNLTEEEAAQVVDAVSGWDHIIYYNYMAGGRDYRDIVESAFKSPLASYLTLLTAHGHKVGECVTLKKVK